MLGVVDEALTSAAGHAGWIEPFNEVFALVARVFAEAPALSRGHRMTTVLPAAAVRSQVR
jgi:hypothetical protein